MTGDELFAELARARPQGEMVSVERRGEDLSWRLAGDEMGASPLPDVWIYFTGSRPEEPERFAAMFDDLLAEMESMGGGADRCRWPLDDPYSHRH